MFHSAHFVYYPSGFDGALGVEGRKEKSHFQTTIPDQRSPLAYQDPTGDLGPLHTTPRLSALQDECGLLIKVFVLITSRP